MNPLVSICCITYNHERYIYDAIEGFLIQKTNFPFEIIIHDDASTDGTANIINEYEKKYSKLFVCIYQNENQYSKHIKISSTYVWPKARGKYIALCEGDDYWTDPYKLQKQVDFLEENPEFSICFHKVMILKNNKLMKDYITDVPGEITTIEDLAHTNYIHTPSVVFRSEYVKNLPEWYYHCPVGDYPLFLIIAQYGKIKYLDKTMAVYRIHQGGTWSQRNKDDIIISNKWIRTYESMMTYFSGNVKEIMIRNLSLNYLDLSDIYRKRGEHDLSIDAFKKSTNNTFVPLYERYYKYKIYSDSLKLFINSENDVFLFIRRNIKKIIKLVSRYLIK